MEASMSTSENSFWASLLVGLSRGAVPVDGMLWVDPNSRAKHAPPATSRDANPYSLAPITQDCEGCPSPIF
jgi:hypothetical protein